ncbi:MAG: hypothetical protein IJU64_02185 [Bacilli bacterium]|nr:hypothetical protein [Bacilli bacterium]
MEITKDNEIILYGENGEETKLNILFYYTNEQRGKDYYFLYRSESPDEIFVLSCADGEHLEECDEEELDEADQVLSAYEEDPTIAEARK